jgi:hypothetical protein
MSSAKFHEVLAISLTASPSIATGIRKQKKRIRRNCIRKRISGEKKTFKCLVEFDVLVSDADLVAHAGTEERLFEFVKVVVCRCRDLALSDFPRNQVDRIQAAVQSAPLPQPVRW